MPATRTSTRGRTQRKQTNGRTPQANGRTAQANGRGAKTADVITLLKLDHKEVNGLFDEVEDLGERAEKQREKLAQQICKALEAHSEFEKTELYPPFKERAEDHEETQQVLEAFEEHAIVDRLVKEIKEMRSGDETLEAKLKVLTESVRHHVKEEEREMFPTVKELFDEEELVELGSKFIEAKRRAGLPVPK